MPCVHGTFDPDLNHAWTTTMPVAKRLAGVGMSHAAFADALVPVVLAAGRLQMQYFQSDVAIQTKADTTPVTVADQESERLILSALTRLAPNVPTVAEEAMAAGNTPQPSDVFFLVDPLDGTREFISGRGEFTVNIALIENTRPVFGVVYAPVTHDLFVTVGPNSVMRARVAPDSAAQSLAELAPHAINVRKPDLQNLTAMVSRSHLTPATEAYLARYTIADTRSAGSSLKFCLLAAGEADVYPRAGITSEWDTAAGQAIVEAAGGCVTTFDGAPLRYGKADVKYRNPDYVAWGAHRPPSAQPAAK
jgi:3'(2'), 5'-bisphosphate nucleotidase